MRRFTVFAVALLLAVGLFVGCGGGESSSSSSSSYTFKSDFPNVHDGEFFKIGYPDNWEVKDDPMSGGLTISPISEDSEDEGEEFNFDMTSITIMDMKSEGTKRGDLSEIEKQMMEEGGEEAMEMMDIEKTTLSGEKALKMSMTFLMEIESYTIPMDGWTISVAMLGGDETAKKILDTFTITNPNYDGSKDMMDVGDDEDFEWGNDDEEEIVWDDEEETEIDLAVGEDYEGEYFTMTIPEGFEINDEDPDEIMFDSPDFMMIVACDEEEGYIWSDTDILKEEVEEEINSGEISVVEEIEIGFNSALWLEGEDSEMSMVMVGIPMTDWIITIMGSGFTSDEAKEQFKSMVMTFDVTDMFYKGME